MTHKEKYLTVRLGDDDLEERLAELARRNERPKSSEARLAIRRHVDEHMPPRPEVRAGG